MPVSQLQVRMPPVETSVVRFIRTRLQVTHEERAICVISGPWGIGKTTAVECFARANAGRCVIVKVEPGSMKRGASPVLVLQQTLEALRPLVGRSSRATLSTAYWSLRYALCKHLEEWSAPEEKENFGDQPPRLTIVFDEAQYLSRESIEMLRFWNDADRTVTPFPLGLIFIGNSEFALQEETSGESTLSGAVRSRSLFIETLDYNDVLDEDIVNFLRSCGAYEDAAISLMLAYFRQRRVRRDFRSMAQLDKVFRRTTRTACVTPEVVQSVLG